MRQLNDGPFAIRSSTASNSDWTKRAKDILERTGAEDIASAGGTKDDTQNRQTEAQSRRDVDRIARRVHS